MSEKLKKTMSGLSLCIVFTAGCIVMQYLVNAWEAVGSTEIRGKVAREDEVSVSADITQLPGETQSASGVQAGLLYENDNFVCYEDRIFTRFSYEEDKAERIVLMTEALQQNTGGKANIYVLPIPGRVVIEDGYQADCGEYERFLKKLSEVLSSNATVINPLPKLQQQREEYLFFKTENAWTMRGAYCGVSEFCTQVGMEPIALSAYREMQNTTEFQGSLMLRPELNLINYLDYEHDSVNYYLLPDSPALVEVQKINKDGTNITCKKPLITVSTRNLSCVVDYGFQRAIVEGEVYHDGKEGEHLLLICDEAGKLMVPFLKDYYDGVYVVNMLEKSGLEQDLEEVFRTYNIKDVLIAQNADEFGNEGYSAALSGLNKTLSDTEGREVEAYLDGTDIP